MVLRMCDLLGSELWLLFIYSTCRTLHRISSCCLRDAVLYTLSNPPIFLYYTALQHESDRLSSITRWLGLVLPANIKLLMHHCTRLPNQSHETGWRLSYAWFTSREVESGEEGGAESGNLTNSTQLTAQTEDPDGRCQYLQGHVF
ncbi:hypothetical protein GGS24DRAFT_400887 [Hypoxylon argillaceum]|nr:hypothetical protein GGS24DRAFT_400887 [Hypoxylon argillaceum]